MKKIIIIAIFFFASAGHAGEEALYFDDVQQIINWIDGNQAYGKVEIRKLRAMLVNTKQHCELVEKPVWKP